MDLDVLTFEGMRKARNLHPLFVHFPLALLPTSFCLYAAGYVARRKDVLFAARLVLALDLFATLLAWFTGFRAEATLGIVQPRGAVLRAHMGFGTTLMAMTVFLFAWSRAHVENAPKHRWAFLAALGFTVLTAFYAGDLGAQLVYQKGASVRYPPAGGGPH